MPHRERQRPHIKRSDERQADGPVSAFADTLRSQLRESSELIGRRLGQVGSAAQNFVGGLSIVNPAMETARSFKRVGKGLRGEAEPTIGDVFNVTGGLAGGGIGAARTGLSKGTVGMFGGTKGVKSLPAKARRVKAFRMERAGRSQQEIHRDTGFSRGPDGRWRFEIDDTQAQVFKPANSSGTAPLNQVLEHPDLFQKYPQLADLEVRFVDDLGSNSGVYRIPTEDRPHHIAVSKTLGKDELRDVILHETQHAVQFIEGFARGGSPSAGSVRQALRDLQARHPDSEKLQAHIDRFEAMPSSKRQELASRVYRRLAGEVESRNVEFRSRLDPEALRQLAPHETERLTKQPSRKTQIVIPEFSDEQFAASILQEMGFGKR